MMISKVIFVVGCYGEKNAKIILTVTVTCLVITIFFSININNMNGWDKHIVNKII